MGTNNRLQSHTTNTVSVRVNRKVTRKLKRFCTLFPFPPICCCLSSKTNEKSLDSAGFAGAFADRMIETKGVRVHQAFCLPIDIKI